MKNSPAPAVDQQRLVRAQCAKAIRDYRAYRKIHPEAFQVWACSEKKGAALLARKISRILGHPNKNSPQNQEPRTKIKKQEPTTNTMPRPKLKPQFRKRQLKLTIKPEMLKMAKAAAHGQGISLSEFVERLLLYHLAP